MAPEFAQAPQPFLLIKVRPTAVYWEYTYSSFKEFIYICMSLEKRKKIAQK
jgi:hypothetical protein